MNRLVCTIVFLLFAGGSAMAQSDDEGKAYFGLGTGFDYGGIGAKIELLPEKYFGFFGGAGYNLASLGWNAGITIKITPDKKVSPNLMVMYGYNGVMKVSGAPQYDKTSYGVTFGMNLDIKTGSRDKLSVGLFVPIRSKAFNDTYDAAKNDSNVRFNNTLLPIAISVGYNFML